MKTKPLTTVALLGLTAALVLSPALRKAGPGETQSGKRENNLFAKFAETTRGAPESAKADMNQVRSDLISHGQAEVASLLDRVKSTAAHFRELKAKYSKVDGEVRRLALDPEQRGSERMRVLIAESGKILKQMRAASEDLRNSANLFNDKYRSYAYAKFGLRNAL